MQPNQTDTQTVQQTEGGDTVASSALLDGISWQKRHGHKAKNVQFQNGDQLNNVESALICTVEYHGDRDEIWIVEVRDGKEMSRHNCKHVESIVWATDAAQRPS